MNYTYITSLTGTLEPGTEMQFATNRLMFVFESDEQNNAAGFTFDFEGIPEVGIAETELMPVSVWPNPSSSMVYVEIGEGSAASFVAMQLCDVFGRKLSEKNAVNAGETVTFDLSDLAKGFYFLRIRTEEGKIVTRKIVRQ